MESAPIAVHHRVFLVGFMGAGKTTVGRLLARRLGWSFADLDESIEAASQRSIPDIFSGEGEPAFRQYESEALDGLLSQAGEEPVVLALGGGTTAQAANRDAIAKAKGLTVWLHCPLEELRRRCDEMTNRPLFEDASQFHQLYETRLPYYESADFRVDASPRDPALIVEEIVQCLPF